LDINKKPCWLDDQEEIQYLLALFLDGLDRISADERKRPLGITLTIKKFPSLFHGGLESDTQWGLIKNLCYDYGLFSICPCAKRDPYEPEYVGARLIINADSEAILRSWLNRPRKDLPLIEWQMAVDKVAVQFSGETKQLRTYRLNIGDRSCEEILNGFIKISCYLDIPVTLRQLSAACFFGLSKFLDGRERLVYSLYPELTLLPRPLVVNIYLPKEVGGVLFIENQDSYTCAINGVPTGVEELALIYSSGFKGSASRVRCRDGALLHLHGDGALKWRDVFESWWFAESVCDWPVYFGGDLDFSGMMILRSIRERFGQIEAWPLGYQKMLKCLESGQGHRLDEAKKQDQTDPGITGSMFADEVLLPAIRQREVFIDQELVV